MVRRPVLLSQRACAVQYPLPQIAAFESGGRPQYCTASRLHIVHNHAPAGMSEMQAIQFMRYAGQPMTMHPILVSGKGPINGLRSATSKLIDYGDAVSTAWATGAAYPARRNDPG